MFVWPVWICVKFAPIVIHVRNAFQGIIYIMEDVLINIHVQAITTLIQQLSQMLVQVFLFIIFNYLLFIYIF